MTEIPQRIRTLRPMLGGVVPITDDERKGRIEKARRLMVEHKIDAVFIEAGTTMRYFTGVQWGLSERMCAVVIPSRGELAYVCPTFEESRMRQLIRFGDDIRTWEEEESPFDRVAEVLKDRGVFAGRIGIEEQTRFFLVDGIAKAAPNAELVSADPVTVGCRAVKSAEEIALLQRANDITVAAYKAVLGILAEGMTQTELYRIAAAAHTALGGVDGRITFNFGEGTALPHGSVYPKELREGHVVLMDGGCFVDGYRSDISRPIVFGEPTQRYRDVWEVQKRAQAAAHAAARVGVPCEDVDAAARKVITDAGFGPGYRLPGLPHRTGHGIGMDVHERPNLVKGNKTPLEPGMCVSNEPMIVLPGEFGVRIEDCMYITEGGAEFFSTPSPSVEQPFV